MVPGPVHSGHCRPSIQVVLLDRWSSRRVSLYVTVCDIHVYISVLRMGIHYICESPHTYVHRPMYVPPYVVYFAGGVVVFAVNSLTYFSQSYPHYGVSLNSLAEKSSTFAFRKLSPL